MQACWAEETYFKNIENRTVLNRLTGSVHHISCTADKAAWRTPTIQMWIFILNLTNIWNSSFYLTALKVRSHQTRMKR